MDILLDELPDFIKSYLKNYEDLLFKKNQLLYTGIYLTGLISDFNKKNIENIDKHRLSGDYKKLRDSISSWKYDEDSINVRRIKLMQHQQQTRSRTDGVVIIDDTGNRKSGEYTFGSRKQYLGCLGKVETGQLVVSSHYTDTTKGYPLHLSLYAPKKWLEEHKDDDSFKDSNNDFKTKGELALEQVKQIDEEDLINYSYLLFDGWYFHNSTFIKGIKDEHFYISQSYRNQRVYFKRKGDLRSSECYLKVVIDDLREDDFHKIAVKSPSGKSKRYYIKSFKLKFKYYGWHRVCICKEKLCDENKTAKILVSNDVDITDTKLIETYLLRDKIEKFYQTVKEHLGADEYQVRKPKSIKRHWLLVYLTYSMIIYYQFTGGISYWTTKMPKTFAEALNVFKMIMLSLFCKFIQTSQERLNDYLYLRLGKIVV